MTSLSLIRLCLILVMMTGTESAVALWQKAPSSLKGLDTQQPIDVEANRLEVNDRDGTAWLSGSVRVVQGRLTLTTESLTIYFNRTRADRDPEIIRIDAPSAVTVTSDTEVVTGSWGVYDVKKRLITLGGTVEMKRPDATLTGTLLQINLVDGITILDHVPPENGTNSKEGRVKGRFLAPPMGKKRPDAPSG